MKSAIRPLAGLIFVVCFAPVALADQSAAEPPAAPDTAATAPSPPAPKPDAPAPVIREIVVTGQRADVETRVDRKIYAVSNDLQANLGSAADVLGNIPSVSVDIDGNPSLRGDADVQIFIDGRPAPEFNGSGRGAALQQLDADTIDRIEILTNPPANFKREGSGGIINIITKRSTSNRTASARASVGTAGRYNAGTRQGAQLGKLNLRSSASVRRDLRIRDITNLRIVRDDAQSVLSDRRQHSKGDDDRLSKTVSLGAVYELSDINRLSAEGSFYRRDADSYLQENNLFLDSNGGTVDDHTRIRRANEFEYNSSAELAFHHKGAGGNDDGLNVRLQRSESKEWRPLRKTISYRVPPQAITFVNQDFLEDEVVGELSIDYTATLASGAKIVAGYDFEDASSYFDVLQTLPVNAGGALVPDLDFTNRFRHAQTIHALYATYEWPLGNWTVLAGLRLEQTDIDIRQVTAEERSRQDYFRAYPSLHLAHKLNEQQTLTFNFARRVDRPYWQSMNPFRIQLTEFSIVTGNPALKPSEVDSMEAGWSYDEGKTSIGATVFARRSRNNLEYVTTPISPTMVAEMPQNVGVSDSGGLELAASGRLLPQLDYKLSGEGYYNEIDAGNLGFTEKRSAFQYEAKGALNWRVTPADSAQLNFNSYGKSLTPQGYFRNGTWVDLGYRHQFRPNFSVSVTATDVFASRRFRFVTDTPALSETRSTRPPGRIFFIGVSWSLAAKKEPAENFEYDN